jgi:peptide deformylase
MAIRKIVLIGDDVLRKKSREVEVIDKRILRLLDDMKDTLYENKGAGLPRRRSASCAGRGGRRGRRAIELINPILTEWSKTETQTDSEGCLSSPTGTSRRCAPCM